MQLLEDHMVLTSVSKKDCGLHVAKLLHFKSGPNIRVYVSFLHATWDLFTAWPAYSVHHCAQSFRADFLDSACK